MTTNTEFALEQALIAVLAAAKDAKIDVEILVKSAESIILDSAHKNNIVDDKAIRVIACEIIESLAAKV